MVDELPDLDGLWDYDQPDATEQNFLAVLPIAESAGDQGYLAELITQLARAQGLQQKFAQAHQTLDRVESMLAGAGTRAQVRYMLERGRVYNSAGDPAAARELFLQAWHLAVANAEDHYAIDAAHMLGIVEKPVLGKNIGHGGTHCGSLSREAGAARQESRREKEHYGPRETLPQHDARPAPPVV